MKLRSLQMKIVFWAGICLLLTAAAIVTYGALSRRTRAKKNRLAAIENAQNYATSIAKQHANHIRAELEVALDTARTLAQALSGITKNTVNLDLDRDEVNGILRIVLAENPQFVGVYTAWEPDAFDELDMVYINEEGHDHTGRFIPYWSRNKEGSIMVEPLVDYQKDGPGDYYQLPQSTKNECIIDPYIYPVQGTPTLITSMVVPIVVDEIFYGIAGVDLRLDILQEPADDVDSLYEGDGQILIISHNGTLAAVTGKPELQGKHMQEMHADWEEDLGYIRNGETLVEEDEGRIAVFTPLKAGRTMTPWSVNVLVPVDKIKAAADEQQRQAVYDMWSILGIGVLGTLVALVLLWFVARSIARPIIQAVGFAEKLSQGDFSAAIDVKQNDEIGMLADALKEMKSKFREMLSETDGLIQAVWEGRLDTRGNADAFAGDWRELILGVNTLIDAFVTPINTTADYIERLSKSDIPEQITAEYTGDFNKIKENLNRLGGDIRNVLAETAALSQAVQAGRLNARGDADAFGGGWRELVVGVNSVLDAFVAPISVTAAYLDRIARGDIPDAITDEYKGDFNAIKQNMNRLIEAMHEITGLAEAMADGNLTVTVTERSAQDVLMQALNTMLKRLNEVVMHVTSAADNMASGSQGMSSHAEEISQGAAGQAAAAEETSSSMEQMASNIRQNADNALQTGKIARQAAENAQEGGHAVIIAVTAMREIAKKISIIEDIARQTHMLSLNATIEAAKAEEQGKGFAVVAAEVRSLAERSREAAEEITALADSGVTIAEKTGELLAQLVPDIQKTAELVQEISAASNEQSTGTVQINRAIQQLDQVTQQNAASSEEMAATAEELASQAEQLQHTIAFFKIDEADREKNNLAKFEEPGQNVHKQEVEI